MLLTGWSQLLSPLTAFIQNAPSDKNQDLLSSIVRYWDRFRPFKLNGDSAMNSALEVFQEKNSTFASMSMASGMIKALLLCGLVPSSRGWDLVSDLLGDFSAYYDESFSQRVGPGFGGEMVDLINRSRLILNLIKAFQYMNKKPQDPDFPLRISKIKLITGIGCTVLYYNGERKLAQALDTFSILLRWILLCRGQGGATPPPPPYEPTRTTPDTHSYQQSRPWYEATEQTVYAQNTSYNHTYGYYDAQAEVRMSSGHPTAAWHTQPVYPEGQAHSAHSIQPERRPQVTPHARVQAALRQPEPHSSSSFDPILRESTNTTVRPGYSEVSRLPQSASYSPRRSSSPTRTTLIRTEIRKQIALARNMTTVGYMLSHVESLVSNAQLTPPDERTEPQEIMLIEWNASTSLHSIRIRSIQSSGNLIYVDASSRGIGFVFSDQWQSWRLKRGWIQQENERAIDVAEAVAVELGLRLMIKAGYTGQRISVRSDSLRVVEAISDSSTSNPRFGSTIDQIIRLCNDYNIQLTISWIPGEINPADKPSRPGESSFEETWRYDIDIEIPEHLRHCVLPNRRRRRYS